MVVYVPALAFNQCEFLEKIIINIYEYLQFSLIIIILFLFSVTGFNVFAVGGAMVAICGLYTVLVSCINYNSYFYGTP